MRPMAIYSISTCTGIDKAMYDTLKEEMAGHGICPGQLLHMGGFDAAGTLRIVDAWESMEDLETAAKKVLMPAFQKFHLAPPKVEIVTIDDLVAFPMIEPYLMKMEG
jgi:hypothetical protein